MKALSKQKINVENNGHNAIVLDDLSTPIEYEPDFRNAYKYGRARKDGS